jgi:hypothetical protein
MLETPVTKRTSSTVGVVERAETIIAIAKKTRHKRKKVLQQQQGRQQHKKEMEHQGMTTTAELPKTGETGILTVVQMQATASTQAIAGTPETLGS